MMNNVFNYLNERINEFNRHYEVAQMLQGRVNDATQDQEMLIEVRHVNTVKSGLIVHLYNIVEAVSSRTLNVVGNIIATEKPKFWKDSVLTEWVRSEIWSSEDKIGEPAIKKLAQLSGKLASGENTNPFIVKGVPGSWDDKSIEKIAKRLDCVLIIPSNINTAARETVFRNNTSALRYLALRRNDLAHGHSTFEEGANDLTLEDVKDIADRIIPFLEEVTKSYEKYLNDKNYLKENEEAA